MSYPLLVKSLPQISPWITSWGRVFSFPVVSSSFRNLQTAPGGAHMQKDLTTLCFRGVTSTFQRAPQRDCQNFLFPDRDQAVAQECPELWDQGWGLGWDVTPDQYGQAAGTTPRAPSLVCPTSGLGCSSGRRALHRSQGKELKKKLKDAKVTAWFCFGTKHKRDRKQLIYLTMFPIITKERQGTLTVLNNQLQTKITRTAASSFIFAFSALIEGLEVDNGGGSSSALYWLAKAVIQN